jgi:hypothetical protein
MLLVQTTVLFNHLVHYCVRVVFVASSVVVEAASDSVVLIDLGNAVQVCVCQQLFSYQFLLLVVGDHFLFLLMFFCFTRQSIFLLFL